MDPVHATSVVARCEPFAPQRFELHDDSRGDAGARCLLCLTRDEAEFIDAVVDRILPETGFAIGAAYRFQRLGPGDQNAVLTALEDGRAPEGGMPFEHFLERLVHDAVDAYFAG